MACSSTAVVVKQFAMYQCVDISICFDKNERMDAVWTAVGKLKDEDGEVYLRELVMCRILTIPHSNAHCKRIFSTFQKNRTDQRVCLGDDTLKALLLKTHPRHPFDTSHQDSAAELSKLNSAYCEANKQYKNCDLG